jgi:hypothetical protein
VVITIGERRLIIWLYHNGYIGVEPFVRQRSRVSATQASKLVESSILRRVGECLMLTPKGILEAESTNVIPPSLVERHRDVRAQVRDAVREVIVHSGSPIKALAKIRSEHPDIADAVIAYSLANQP